MKNKQRFQHGSFERKQKTSFFRRKYLVLAALIFVVSFGGYYGLKHRSNKQAVVSGIGTADEQTPAWWLQKYFSTSTCTSDSCKPESDPDNDKLTNAQEFYYHSDPMNPRTIDDALDDGQLVAQGFDPSKPGKITFDEAVSEDNILYESIVYEEDVKKMISDSQDINKVPLPLPLDIDLKISTEDSPESIQRYFDETGSIVNDYFPKSNMENLKTVLKSGDAEQIESIKESSQEMVSELKQVSVPARLLTFHKYTIAFYTLLAEVLPGPNMADKTAIDHWYDNARSFLAVQQKLEYEKQILVRESTK